MQKQALNSISITSRLLVITILLGCSLSSPGAAVIQSSEGKPCAEGSIIITKQADAPVRLSIQKAICGDLYSNVDLILENISTKPIRGYSVSQIKVYENIRGGESSHIEDGVNINPGESVKVNFNGGFLKGYSYGRPTGLFKQDIYRISWIGFSDSTNWGQVPQIIQNPPRGNDLKLRDDQDAFVAAFQYQYKSFSIMSCDEYGFGGPGLKIETDGCIVQLTFDFKWRQDFSYHPRKKPDVTITIKADDNLHGEFIYDSCAKVAKGFIRNDNQNIILMKLSDTDTSGKRAYCSGPPDYK
jgi:hypothetical protein